jgi:hypothetical protein
MIQRLKVLAGLATGLVSDHEVVFSTSMRHDAVIKIKQLPECGKHKN